VLTSSEVVFISACTAGVAFFLRSSSCDVNFRIVSAKFCLRVRVVEKSLRDYQGMRNDS